MERTGGSETTPGSTFDFTFRFDDGCAAPTDEITIILHEDIGVPSGFDGEDDVVIFASGRYYPTFADPGDSGEDTEITLPSAPVGAQLGDADFRLDCANDA